MRRTSTTVPLSTAMVNRSLSPYSPSHAGHASSELGDFQQETSLAGKVAVVSGGAIGLGRELSIKLAQEGASVAIAYFESEFEQAKQALSDVERWDVKAGIFELDAQYPEDCVPVVEEIVDFLGEIDILINCRAPTKPVPASEPAEEEHLYMVLAALPYLAEEACVINAGPAPDLQKELNLLDEFELKSFHQLLQKAMKERHIRVNYVSDQTPETYLFLAMRRKKT